MTEANEIHLFIPGPVGVEPEVLEALSRPMTPHYGGEFVASYRRCQESLKRVYGTENEIYLIVGPGTSALDAAFTSALPDGARVLVPANGWFGRRTAEMCRKQGADVELLDFADGEPVDADQVIDRLASSPGYDAVAWVHHETSTGVLNPVRPIAGAARRHGTLSILDAVSSIGGAELPVDEWGIDLCVTVPNKCLGGVPGISSLSVSPQAWEAIEANDATRGWYMDLRTWREYDREWTEWHPYPTTQPVNVIAAWNAALDAILEEGLETRLGRTAAAAGKVRTRLRELGFSMLVEDEWASPITTSVRSHPGLPADDLLTWLREERGIYVSGGLAELHGQIFRIGHMGTAIREEEVDYLLDAIETCLVEKGVDLPRSVETAARTNA